MSDQLPPVPSRDDRVRDTLTALRVDADGCGLNDAATVRRRGQARTRHQAAVAVCAAVVVVVVTVSGGALFGGKATTAPPMPATPTPKPSVLTLALDPLLRAGDVGPIGPYESFRISPDPVDEQQRPLRCIASPTTLGAAAAKAALFYSDLDATFIEHVLRFADSAAATEAVTELSTDFASCAKGKPGEVTVHDRGPTRIAAVGADSEYLHADRLSTPTADAGIAYYELGVRRSANVVVVLEWSSMGKPEKDAAWLWSRDLLDIAANRASG